MLKNNYFAQLAPKQHMLKRFIGERGLLHLNIVYSKFLQALSTILTNQCQKK